MGLGIVCSSVELYAAFPIYKAFFANLLGCLCMGIFSQLKSRFEKKLKFSKVKISKLSNLRNLNKVLTVKSGSDDWFLWVLDHLLGLE